MLKIFDWFIAALVVVLVIVVLRTIISWLKSQEYEGSRWFSFSSPLELDSGLFLIQKWIIGIFFIFKILIIIDWLLPLFLGKEGPNKEWIGHRSAIGQWFGLGWEIFLFLTSIFIVLLCLFVRFVIVKQNTAVAIMKFGSFYRMVFAKKGYALKPDGEVYKPKSEENAETEYKLFGFPWERYLGGLRPYIWLLEEPYVYTWSFNKSLPNGDIEFREDEVADHIKIMQDYSYGMEVSGTNIVDKNGVPVEIILALTAHINNPRKALFDVTHWFDVFLARIEPAIRGYVNSHTYQDMIHNQTADKKEERLDGRIFNALKSSVGEKDIIDILSDDYGVKLTDIQCRRFSVAGDYQASLTEKWQAEQDAQKRTESTMGAIIAMMAKARGKSVAEVQAEFNKNPEVQKMLLEMSLSLVEQQLAAESGSLKRWVFSGAQGGMDIVAALTEALRRGGGGSTP